MDPMAAYRRLAQLLIDVVPASIEIIPGSHDGSTEDNPHHPFLLIDGNLGIPQSVLYKTYLLAIQHFSRLPKPKRIPDRGDETQQSDLMSSTAIILVANPGHHTALNRRKQLVQLNLPLITPCYELKFTAALLSIKQTSKASFLWHHRRWLLRRIHGHPSSPADPSSLRDVSIPCDVLAAELHLAAQASEIYPRNYHAWLHRYICMQCLISRASEAAGGALDILHSELMSSQRWIELHISDHTAVHYRSRLVVALENSDIQISFSQPSPSMDASSASIVAADDRIMVSHAFSLLASYPKHESLWMYLRLAFAILHNQPGLSLQWITNFALFFYEADHVQSDQLAELSPIESVVQQMLASVQVEEVSKVKRHALGLFIWTLYVSGKLHLRNAWVQRLLVDSELPAPSHLRELHLQAKLS